MTKGQILLADNEPDFLSTRAEYLERHNYTVFTAASPQEVREHLTNHYIHVAILDIRLVNDDDERDKSGLMLAQDRTFAPIPKIIFTDFPTYQNVREALSPTSSGLSPADRFVAKKEGPTAMLSAVDDIMEDQLNINHELDIRFGEKLSFLYLVNLLEPDLDNGMIAQRATELEDLFRRLFHTHSQIIVNRLLVHRQDKLVVTVFAFATDGTEQRYLVSCGERHYIRTETQLYDQYGPSLSELGITHKGPLLETMNYAVVNFIPARTDLTELTTLTKFYRNASSPQVQQALTDLCQNTLMSWYQNGRFQSTKQTLGEFFLEWAKAENIDDLKRELQPRFESICHEANVTGVIELTYLPHQITLSRPDGTTTSYPNPMSYLTNLQEKFAHSTLCGTTYGQLNGETVLIDQSSGHAWLIDFNQIKRGPLFRDFVSLEFAIKSDLLTANDIEICYILEQLLLANISMDEVGDDPQLDTHFNKALQTIYAIRRIAFSLLQNNTNVYLGGMLFYTCRYLQTYDVGRRHIRQELIAYIHALLSAAMLCQHLLDTTEATLSDEATQSVWLDETTREVRVEGQPKSLTRQEFSLLSYLYQRPGQLCHRTELAQAIYETEYGDDVSQWEAKKLEDARLNSTMSRLRKKIEPDPDHPKYIIAIRGEGYRLLLGQT